MTRGLGPRLYGVLAATIGSVGIGLLAFFLTDQRGSIRVDGPATKALTVAALIDAGLVLLFGLQHSLMARPSVKRWVARVLSESGVRSTYVMMSGLMLILLVCVWQPIPVVLYRLDAPLAIGVMWLFFIAGLLLAGAATVAIDFWDLMGLRQSGVLPERDDVFTIGWLHRRVRHPIYTGLILIFWCTPTMSYGRLLLAIAMTLYIRIGIHFEERDLQRRFGDTYTVYRTQVPMLIPTLSPYTAPKTNGPD
jgi:methanethiol S-methyltransferase